jgi:hypothetical protein
LEKLNGYILDKNSAVITAAYNKVMYQLATDSGFKKMISNCADFELTSVPFEDKTCVKFFPISNLLDNDDLRIIREQGGYFFLEFGKVIDDDFPHNIIGHCSVIVNHPISCGNNSL